MVDFWSSADLMWGEKKRKLSFPGRSFDTSHMEALELHHFLKQKITNNISHLCSAGVL